MAVMSLVWGLILFVPLSGIAAAIYLALALARRGTSPAAPAIGRAGGPSGMLLALVVVGSLIVILVVVSAIFLLGAGSRVLTTPP